MARSMRPIEVFPITTRRLQVLRITDVTPGMRRITLGGPGLAPHHAPNGMEVGAFRSDGFDDEFKIFLRHPDAEAPVVPEQRDGTLNWPRENPHLVFRTYTARRWDAQAGELDFDLVMHGVGAATSWARQVKVGDYLDIAGPKSSAGHPRGAQWVLAIADESALPAVGRWLEEWPTGCEGHFLIEIERDEHRQDLPIPPGVNITWLSHEGAAAGTTTLLFDALQKLEWPEDKKVYAWAAGEAITLVPIRRWLKKEKGLPREQMEVTGYWRLREVTPREDNPELPDSALDATPHEAIERVTSIISGMAVRALVSTGLANAMLSESRSVDQLCQTTGIAPNRLRALLRYLIPQEIIRADGADRYSLTSLGQMLTEEHFREHLDIRDAEGAQLMAAALRLLPWINPSFSEYLMALLGGNFEDNVLNNEDLLRSRIDAESGMASYAAPMLPRLPIFRGASAVTVAGFGALTFAQELVAQLPTTGVTVVSDPLENAVLNELADPDPRLHLHAGSLFEARPSPTDVFLLIFVLQRHSDLEMIHILRQAAASLSPGGKIVVVTRMLDTESPDARKYEEMLADAVLYDGGDRSRAEVTSIIAQAGLSLAHQAAVGWGYHALVLTGTNA